MAAIRLDGIGVALDFPPSAASSAGHDAWLLDFIIAAV